MFSPQTEFALNINLAYEAHGYGLVTLNADAYRELVFAARQWDAMRSGPVSYSGVIQCTTQPNGDLRFD